MIRGASLACCIDRPDEGIRELGLDSLSVHPPSASTRPLRAYALIALTLIAHAHLNQSSKQSGQNKTTGLHRPPWLLPTPRAAPASLGVPLLLLLLLAPVLVAIGVAVSGSARSTPVASWSKSLSSATPAPPAPVSLTPEEGCGARAGSGERAERPSARRVSSWRECSWVIERQRETRDTVSETERATLILIKCGPRKLAKGPVVGKCCREYSDGGM